LPYYLLFYCYGAHRDLHSFPTRRSSDLTSTMPVDAASGTVVTVGTFDGVHRGHIEVLHRLDAAAAKQGALSVLVTFDPHPLRIVDRKSTRLNSSHVKISYAVFCLKKKKQ